MDRLTVLLATTAATLGATTLWFAQHSVADRDRASELAARVAILESALDRVTASSTAGTDSTPAVDPEPSDPPAEPDATQTTPQPRDRYEWVDRFRDSEAQLLRNTQYREHWLMMKTLSLRETYADLQRLLGLSDAEFEAFLATMAQFEIEQTLRNLEYPLQKGLDTAGRVAAVQQQSADTETARRQALRDALGETPYQQWIDHQQTAQGRRELERWRIDLATVGMPLTPGQAEDLLPILAEHQQRIAALTHPAAFLGRAHARPTDAFNALMDLERRIGSQAEINAWLDDALTGVLTPEQRELITATGDRAVELQRAQLELDRLRLADQDSP